MLYAAYFSKPEDGPPKHGIIKVDPVDLSIRAQLALEPYGVFGFPEGFVWHDGYLFSCAFGIKRKTSAAIAKIEPHSMTFVGAVTLPQNEGTHGINYDGSRLYALGVPLFSGTATADRYYSIDPDTLQVEQGFACRRVFTATEVTCTSRATGFSTHRQRTDPGPTRARGPW